MASPAQKESTQKVLCKFGKTCTYFPRCRSHHNFENSPDCKKITDGQCTYPGFCKYVHPEGCIFNKSQGKPPGKFEGKPPGKFEGKPPGKFEGKPPGKFEGKPPGKDFKKVSQLSDEERMEMRLLELQLKAMRGSSSANTK
jgi:hypothetical protein